MQTWPALRYLLDVITLTATSRSASSKTITGACPPSSMVTRFICKPASAASFFPTAVDPVKEIFRITGCGIKYSEMSDGTPKTRFTAPATTPAREKASTSAAQGPGVSSGPLRIIEQPEASAMLILRTAWLIGKFQGENAATGPTGSFTTS